MVMLDTAEFNQLKALSERILSLVIVTGVGVAATTIALIVLVVKFNQLLEPLA